MSMLRRASSSLARAGGPPIDETEAAGLPAEHDVLGHREARQEVDLLIHGADARRLSLSRVGDRHRLSAEQDLAVSQVVDAGQCLDER
jgi:hypothetical protein